MGISICIHIFYQVSKLIFHGHPQWGTCTRLSIPRPMMVWTLFQFKGHFSDMGFPMIKITRSWVRAVFVIVPLYWQDDVFILNHPTMDARNGGISYDADLVFPGVSGINTAEIRDYTVLNIMNYHNENHNCIFAFWSPTESSYHIWLSLYIVLGCKMMLILRPKHNEGAHGQAALVSWN